MLAARPCAPRTMTWPKTRPSAYAPALICPGLVQDSLGPSGAIRRRRMATNAGAASGDARVLHGHEPKLFWLTRERGPPILSLNAIGDQLPGDDVTMEAWGNDRGSAGALRRDAAVVRTWTRTGRPGDRIHDHGDWWRPTKSRTTTRGRDPGRPDGGAAGRHRNGGRSGSRTPCSIWSPRSSTGSIRRPAAASTIEFTGRPIRALYAWLQRPDRLFRDRQAQRAEQAAQFPPPVGPETTSELLSRVDMNFVLSDVDMDALVDRVTMERVLKRWTSTRSWPTW